MAQTGSTKPIGVGLVGYGLAGKVFHGILVKHTPGLEVRAIMTANEARRAQAREDFPSATLYDDYESLLADDDVQLIVIGTPHETHQELAILAADRGKHIVVDKIMARSSQEADDMIAAAERNNVMLSIFHNRRWDSDFLTVKRAIQDGVLGNVYTVESSVVRYAKPPDPNGPLPWRLQSKHGGGPFHDWGAHLMDQAVQLFGLEIESVHADFQFRWPGIDVETAATCDLRFAGGVRYRVEVGSISLIGRPRWYIRGSKGALRIEGLDPQEAAQKEGRVISGTNNATMPSASCQLISPEGERTLPIVPGDYLAYYRNVEQALRGHEALAVHPAEARSVLRVMEAAVESARTGQIVTPVVND